MSVCPSWQIQALIWRLYDMSMMWRCLYDMDMMWRCLCSEKTKCWKKPPWLVGCWGPGPGSTSTVDLGFRKEGSRRNQYQGCFFWFKLYSQPSLKPKKIYTRLTSPKSWRYYRPCYDFCGFAGKKLLFFLHIVVLLLRGEQSYPSIAIHAVS